ncbi:aconitase/3-isopropylmalate dehydratase large subunit family protein [Salinigranum halophilum]|jgi:3-isopropylmalate/(R)-2-methylmalate dehydratase large subunit|uniref:aconitase/3-isopropylmalate dehydratase large subunit family protein n=1 Tax=Salinigranum halophilum TaxID=2565931 RepID=UPI00115C8774|nr:aconitase/3-isopropylmalate dehydratase large subunit family protein [Salinigranum halophilum]
MRDRDETKTFAENLLSAKSGADVRAGEYVEAHIDVAMAHDITGPLAFDTFEEVTGGDGTLFAPERTVFTIDHHAPADGVQAANNHNRLREFAAEHGAAQYDVGDGICHQVLVEEGFVGPGDLVIGADSHSTTYGGLGGFGTGVGSSDLGTALATGELWFRVPTTLRFEVDGDLADGVYAKDLILRFIGDVGFDGCTYRAAEYAGSTVESLPIYERLVLANMAIEMGGKAGIVEADDRTVRFLEAQTGDTVEIPAYAHAGESAEYEAVYSYDGSAIAPQVSKPSNPENAVDVTDVEGTPLDQLFVGTCTNGRYEDIRLVADILAGEELAPGVRMVVVPASGAVYREMLATGVTETLVDAGAIVQAAGCGPCAGYHQGVLGDGDVCLATANRNFPGREGSMESRVYLASPATVGVSALYGEITDPRTHATNRYDDHVVSSSTTAGGAES